MLDVQNLDDDRKIPIRYVGIKNVQYPIKFIDSDAEKNIINSVGNFDLYVDLPKEKKGTHMSRFLPILADFSQNLSMQNLIFFNNNIRLALESDAAYIGVSFPFFQTKFAPVSQTAGLLNVEVKIITQYLTDIFTQKLSVIVPIKSLCPCSKAISQYGAHSQRGLITINLWNTKLSIAECISCAEQAASSPIYPILKREDEKYITEQAYNKPRFVEDLVRETALLIKNRAPETKFEISAENFESIHNHNAWAYVCSEDIYE